MHYHITWSALSCAIPGAGVYCGTAPLQEHIDLARGLSFPTLRVFADGVITLRSHGRAWLINYFALRDPSEVKVVPIPQPPANGFEHARLLFSISDVPKPRNACELSGLNPKMRTPEDLQTEYAFLLTVGLSPQLEEELFQHAFADHPDQDWEQVRLRLSELGCGEPKRGPKTRLRVQR